ncbi:hypothetical protein NQZ79_g8473 [Umbelopsis isabellina]|nr:hypothetical protein NQZ79_g8473 [Umbelopsis isabellina]
MEKKCHNKEVDPYESHVYDLFRWRGSIISAILPFWFTSVAWSALISALYVSAGVKQVGTQNTLITILSLVTSLILVFRTNTAYDRFWEGRRLWSQLVVSVRNMARVIWIHGKEPAVADVLAKKTAINLLAAFGVATKHYLRQEYSHEYEDLKYLIAHIPKYTMPSSNESLQDQVDKPSSWQRWLHPTSGTNGIRKRKSIFHTKSKSRSTLAVNPEANLNEKEVAHFRGSNNIPLEISLYLSSYINSQRNKDLLDVPSTTACMNALNSLVECLTGFERILRTPIPAAYSIHLSQTIWVYLFALPFQLVIGFGYVTIIVQAIASFTLLGIEAIGKEIENPFGLDANDLPLDDFCQILTHELDSLTSKPPPSVDEWVFSPRNHPFHNAQGLDVTAQDLRRASMDEVRSLLSVTSETKSKAGVHMRSPKKRSETDESTLDEKHIHEKDAVYLDINDRIQEEEKQGAYGRDHQNAASTEVDHQNDHAAD